MTPCPSNRCRAPSQIPTSSTVFTAVQVAMNVSLPPLTCPSDPNERFKYPLSVTHTNWWWNQSQFFQSSYVGMASSCKDALAAGLWPASYTSPYTLPPLPASMISRLPDGALFPNGVAPKLSDFTDGTSTSIMCTETRNNMQNLPTGPSVSDRGGWVFPAATIMFGMAGPVPENPNDPNDVAINYVGYPTGAAAPAFYAPSLYDPTNPMGPTAPTNAYRTYLAYDFEVMDVNSFTNGNLGTSYLRTGNLGSGNDQVRPQRGPGSAHPEVVNHLFADGCGAEYSQGYRSARRTFS